MGTAEVQSLSQAKPEGVRVVGHFVKPPFSGSVSTFPLHQRTRWFGCIENIMRIYGMDGIKVKENLKSQLCASPPILKSFT